MQSTLYWTFLVFISILLAYISPFNLAPLVFLIGGAMLGLGHFLFRRSNRPRSGLPDSSARTVRLIGSIMVYVMTFWTTMGLFTNVKEQHEFMARYEPYLHEGMPRGYTFHYLDHPGSYERIDSPDLNKFLAETRPESVRLTLEVVRDFGRLRAYTVRSVESISVDKFWTDGSPPWNALR